MSKVIKLSGKRATLDNSYAIVDDEDYDKLTAIGTWHLNDGGYAVRRSNGVTVRMHTVVNNTPNNKVTDHINRNRLDNRKENLRSVTQSENLRNIERGRGYWKHSQTGKWVVDIYSCHVGCFDEEEFANQIATMIYEKELPLTRINIYSPYCKRGHNKDLVGRYGNECKSCILDNQKRYYERKMLCKQ